MYLRKSLALTRRELFQTASAAIAGVALTPHPASGAHDGTATVRRVSERWEYYRGDLRSVWEAWRGKAASDNVAWDKVAMPHCFNAFDAVDPDHACYQGPDWYRTTFATQNPFPGCRLALDGAIQGR